MGLQLANAVLLTWGFWHPQYGGSLSDVLPGPRFSNASDVAISTKWCPAAGGLQRLYFPACAEKVFPRSQTKLCVLLDNDLAFQFCAEFSQSPVAAVLVAFLEGPSGRCRGTSITMLHQGCPQAAQYRWQWVVFSCMIWLADGSALS